MSKTDFENKLAEISAIDKDELYGLYIPVSVYIQEAEDLNVWCLNDKEKLEAAGLDWNLVTDLPARCGALQYAQSLWNREYKMYTDSVAKWMEKAPEGYELRDEMVHHFFHAFRSQPDVYGKIQTISEGDSNDDMIQDLSDLAVIGRKYPENLEAIGFDPVLLDQAEALADELGAILARSNGSRNSLNPAKLVRDKAYLFLKKAVDEIRINGQYVFWRNDKRGKGYSSTYLKRRKGKSNVPEESQIASEQE